MRKVHERDYYERERHENIAQLQNAIEIWCGIEPKEKLQYIKLLLESSKEDNEQALKDGCNIVYRLDYYTVPSEDSSIAEAIHGMVHAYNIECTNLRNKYFP